MNETNIKTSDNKRQKVTNDSVVIFDDVTKLIGSSISKKSFEKYKIKNVNNHYSMHKNLQQIMLKLENYKMFLIKLYLY